MDKYVARKALEGKGFYTEQRGKLLLGDNELIHLYQEVAARPPRKRRAGPPERTPTSLIPPH